MTCIMLLRLIYVRCVAVSYALHRIRDIYFGLQPCVYQDKCKKKVHATL